MAKDTWALLGVFAAGFLLLAGLILGVYDRLDARIESVDAKLSGEIKELQAGQRVIRERLIRLETAVGVAGLDLPALTADEVGVNG